ncbi:MAG: redox-sensing transcriptional repressor Rex [Pyrinomonadaceae bacterium]
MKGERISELTTLRLSVYLRCLNELSANGIRTISSYGLAERFHLNAAQIRKDLAYFGEFGVRGVGYYVATLAEHLMSILGLDKEHRVCIVGAGRLGTALADYYAFQGTNFTVFALFDSDPEKVGKKIGKIKVNDIKCFDSVVKRDKIEVAIIAVPANAAEEVLEAIVASGIKAVLNFAPVRLKVSADVKLKTVDLTTALESLSSFLVRPPDSNGQRSTPAK